MGEALAVDDFDVGRIVALALDKPIPTAMLLENKLILSSDQGLKEKGMILVAEVLCAMQDQSEYSDTAIHKLAEKYHIPLPTEPHSHSPMIFYHQFETKPTIIYGTPF